MRSVRRPVSRLISLFGQSVGQQATLIAHTWDTVRKSPRSNSTLTKVRRGKGNGVKKRIQYAPLTKIWSRCFTLRNKILRKKKKKKKPPKSYLTAKPVTRCRLVAVMLYATQCMHVLGKSQFECAFASHLHRIASHGTGLHLFDWLIDYVIFTSKIRRYRTITTRCHTHT